MVRGADSAHSFSQFWLTAQMLEIDSVSNFAARLLAATTLRNVLGTLTLGDILCQREAIAREMKAKTNIELRPLTYIIPNTNGPQMKTQFKKNQF